MDRYSLSLSICLTAMALAQPVRAEDTPAPPAWQDSPSVYLGANQHTPPTATAENTPYNTPPAEATASTAELSAAANRPMVDTAVEPAALETTSAPLDAQPIPNATIAEQPGRRLAPPSSSNRYANEDTNADGHERELVKFGLPTKSMYTIGTALTIVAGTFLLFVWVLRRGARKGGNSLPAEVVSVLGRVPLTAKQYAQLLRVGNKLVLVSLTPSGSDTITEITDQVEVDRIMGLCQQGDAQSTTNAFEHVFRQYSKEPTRSSFLGDTDMPTHLSPIAGAYKAHRGDTARV